MMGWLMVLLWLCVPDAMNALGLMATFGPKVMFVVWLLTLIPFAAAAVLLQRGK